MGADPRLKWIEEAEAFSVANETFEGPTGKLPWWHTHPLLEAMRTGLEGYPPLHGFLYKLAQLMKPSVVVEIGTDMGRGTAHLYTSYLGSKVYSIDPNPRVPEEWRRQMSQVRFFVGRSEWKAIQDSIPPIDLLFIDGEHTRKAVNRDLAGYLPKLRKDGIVVLDDIYLGDMVTGVAGAWSELKRLDIGEMLGLNSGDDETWRNEDKWQMMELEIGKGRSGVGIILPPRVPTVESPS